MNKWHTICATICFLAFVAMLAVPSALQRHYNHELQLAKVKAGCTKEE